MSRILRRPMFRGGPVSSYGTGIAAPLVPGYKGGGQIGGGIIYGKPMADGRYGFADSYLDSLKQHYGMGSGVAFDTERFPGESDIYKNQLKDEDLLPGTGETGTNWLKWLADQGPEGAQDLYDTVLEEQQAVEDRKDFFENKNKNELVFPADAEEMGVAVDVSEQNKPLTELEKLKLENERLSKIIAEGGGDDPTNLETGDLEAMIGRYEKILGGDKAFSQDVGDMALRLAGAKGNTVMEKLQNWFGDESKAGPSRTEKIKQAAGMLGIKGEQAKEIAALQATGRLYAPGITQKTATYIKSLPKGSAEHATALAQIKWPPTLDRKIAEDQMSGPVTLDDIDVYAGVYIDNYKGRLVEGAIDGVYLNAGDSSLVWVDDKGEVIRTKQLDIK